jgi:hypothetical protein
MDIKKTIGARMNDQEKLAVTEKVLKLLKSEIPEEQYLESSLEVLMLAYHASTSTDWMSRLLGRLR